MRPLIHDLEMSNTLQRRQKLIILKNQRNFCEAKFYWKISKTNRQEKFFGLTKKFLLLRKFNDLNGRMLGKKIFRFFNRPNISIPFKTALFSYGMGSMF